MTKINRKLKSNHGETLAEVLVAIIIVSLSSVMFLNMVRAAANITERVSVKDQEFYESIKLLEAYPASSGIDKTTSVTITINESESVSESIGIYETNSLYSYSTGE